MPLVGYVTARFLGRGYEYEDLYQYGCIGLIKAVDRFNPDYGVAFSTYAVPLIIGEIKRFLRGDGSVHVSRTIKENARRVMCIIEDAEKEGIAPTIEYISSRTGLDRQEAVLAISALSPVKSIYEPISADGEIQIQDMLSNESVFDENDSIAVSQAMCRLDLREKELIIRRYYKRHTQTAIANEFGMTQVQISRLEKKILEKLQKMLV